VRKSVFYIRTNIVKKNGGEKPAKQFFQKHTNSAPKKVGKKIVGKKFEKRFYIRTNTVFKNGGEKRAKQFTTNKRKVRPKNVGEKIGGKKCEKASFISAQLL